MRLEYCLKMKYKAHTIDQHSRYRTISISEYDCVIYHHNTAEDLHLKWHDKVYEACAALATEGLYSHRMNEYTRGTILEV